MTSSISPTPRWLRVAVMVLGIATLFWLPVEDLNERRVLFFAAMPLQISLQPRWWPCFGVHRFGAGAVFCLAWVPVYGANSGSPSAKRAHGRTT